MDVTGGRSFGAVVPGSGGVRVVGAVDARGGKPGVAAGNEGSVGDGCGSDVTILHRRIVPTP